MEEKIKQYVNYQFRFDKREDIDDLKEEIIANLIDRYNEYLSSGKNPEEAYITAIKSMGDFSENPINDISPEYSIKPSIPDILLLCSTILSVFGLLIILFNVIVGTITTAISIILYSASSHYLYSYSQYVRKEYKDIEKHNLLLTKIFKYLKTNFIFWAISLSFILSSLTVSILKSYVLFDPKFTLFSDIKDIIILYVTLFILFLFIFLLLFRHIYKRLMEHYYLLTGTNYLKGKIKESYEFLFGKVPKFKFRDIFLNDKIVSLIVLLIILIQLFLKITVKKYTIVSNYSTLYFIYLFWNLGTKYFISSLAPLLFIIINITIILLILFNKLKNKMWLLFISFYLWFGSTHLLYTLFEKYDIEVTIVVLIYTYIMTILFTIFLIVRYFIKRRIENGTSR